MKHVFRGLFLLTMTAAALTACAGCKSGNAKTAGPQQPAEEAPKVYFTRAITPEALVRLYQALGREAEGKVAVKLSTGEPGGHNFLRPDLIADLVRKLDGTIVECNTAYGGGRASTADHLKAAEAHGFTAIAPVDIMDAEGETALPVSGGRHLKEDFVGSHLTDYDFVVVLSHFKGHAMGGFGGAVKNISMASPRPPGKHGSTRRARARPTCGTTCRRRTTSWSRWPKPQKPWPTTAGSASFTSA